MDLWHVSGSVLSDEAGEGWQPLASFSMDLPLEVSDENPDPVHSLLRAIRLWSEVTIRG